MSPRQERWLNAALLVLFGTLTVVFWIYYVALDEGRPARTVTGEVRP